ncbi:hypothetical protein XENORESO_015962 [Xenotaenia resolanae]|uniref:Uncharacterized protein n=1 Tax=Xenotaenia resolanae TaxID=208358 RepID=A0ABV0VX07_9TELE
MWPVHEMLIHSLLVSTLSHDGHAPPGLVKRFGIVLLFAVCFTVPVNVETSLSFNAKFTLKCLSTATLNHAHTRGFTYTKTHKRNCKLFEWKKTLVSKGLLEM